MFTGKVDLLAEYSVHEKVTGHGSNDDNAFARNESISYCITMRTQCWTRRASGPKSLDR